jgi:PiT family inorganic phosphate transporter
MVAYIVIIILIALIFDFYNGMNDAANSIATVVATRVLSPRLAVLWAAFFNFIAAFCFNTHVASTIGKGLIAPSVVEPHLVLATLLAGILWTAVCTHMGLPISVSHALIGGLAGSALVKGGLAALTWSKIGVVAMFIVLSPLIGLACAAIIMVATMWICRHQAPRRVDGAFRILQLASAAVYSLSHGLNDAQKTMGIILALLISVPSLAQYAYRQTPGGGEPELAWWIILSCHAAIALGTYSGGWKVIRTLGHRVTKLTPFDGFSAEAGGGATIIVLSILGIPVSTTHTITGAIFGVGVIRRLGSVRWSVGRDIVIAWVLTLPASAAAAAIIYTIIRRFA